MIKRLLLAILVTFIYSGWTFAQYDHSDLEAQNRLELSYTAPDPLYTFTKLFIGDLSQGVERVKLQFIGPIGARYERRIDDRVSIIGFEMGFAYSTYHFEYFKNEYDSTQQQNVPVLMVEDVKYSRFWFLPMVNINLVRTERFELNTSFHIGYIKRNILSIVNGVKQKYPDFISYYGAPFTLNLGIGARYYFSENWGAHFTAGLGQLGPFNFGVSYRF